MGSDVPEEGANGVPGLKEHRSFDRATEIASRLASCPGPEHVQARAYADVRPVDERQPDFEG